MQNVVSTLSLEETTYDNRITSAVTIYHNDPTQRNKELNNNKIPTSTKFQVGIVYSEYPYGYGFCQCGCGEKSYRTKGGYLKYKKLHLPERIELIKGRKLKEKEKHKEWYIKNRENSYSQ